MIKLRLERMTELPTLPQIEEDRARVCRQLHLTQSLTLAYHWQCSLQLLACQIYLRFQSQNFFFSVKKRSLYSNWTYWEAFLQSMGISELILSLPLLVVVV